MKQTESPATGSWYMETSNSSTPSPRACTPLPLKTMKLREGSLNEKTPPPLGSPLSKPVKGRRKARLTHHSTSFNSTKYIDYLEAEISSLHAKIDALTSPTTTRAQSAKARAVNSQMRSLKQELSEWEKKFEDRVADEVFLHTQGEKGLKDRIKGLQEEGESKDVKIQELQWEVDHAYVKVKQTESLESTNHSLERRVDVLTELLAQSPTRLDFKSPFPIAGGADPSKRTAQRPMSMFLPPRIPPSPCATRRSSNVLQDDGSWNSGSLMSGPSVSGALDEVVESSTDASRVTGSSQYSSRSTSLESRPDRSTSVPPRPSFSSRPTSTISNPAFSTATGFLSSAGYSEDLRSTGKQRKMRRFPAGFGSLKPLVLPVAAAMIAGLPASAPVFSSCCESPSRNTSSCSTDDPTATLLSEADHLQFTTPTQSSRRRSTSWVHQEGLQETDSIPQWSEDGLNELENSPPELAEEAAFEDTPVSSELELSRKSNRRSLQMELELAEKVMMENIDQPTDTEGTDQLGDVELSRITVYSDQEAVISDPPNLCFDVDSNVDECRRSISPTDDFERSEITHAAAQNSTGLLTSLDLTTTKGIYGAFGRLTGIVALVKQEPLALARRLLLNALSIGSARLGKVGRWLLGLVFGSRRKARDMADRKVAEEKPPSDINWCQLTPEGNQATRPEHFWLQRDHSGAGQDPIHPTRFYSHSLATLKSTSKELVCLALQNFSLPLDNNHTCVHCVENCSTHSIRLWFRFSVALVLAIGIAIKDGPGAFLVGRRQCRHRQLNHVHDSDLSDEKKLAVVEERRRPSRYTTRSICEKRGRGARLDGTFGYFPEKDPPRDFWDEEITWVENLMPRDFEAALPGG